MLEQVVHIVATLLGIVKFGKHVVHLHEVTSRTEVSLYCNDTLH
jgi:hypothetical protein